MAGKHHQRYDKQCVHGRTLRQASGTLQQLIHTTNIRQRHRTYDFLKLGDVRFKLLLHILQCFHDFRHRAVMPAPVRRGWVDK